MNHGQAARGTFTFNPPLTRFPEAGATSYVTRTSSSGNCRVDKALSINRNPDADRNPENAPGMLSGLLTYLAQDMLLPFHYSNFSNTCLLNRELRVTGLTVKPVTA